MPSDVKLLRVLISSPDDVGNEREQTDEVIHEVNRLLGDQAGVRLESVRWERDATPGLGTDPQAVITATTSAADIYVGILWTRLGTPTPRSASGTVEELEQAIARARAEPDSVKVMVFFSKAAVPIEDVDPDQLARLKNFKAGLREEGILYADYADHAEFPSVLRRHLMDVARQWGVDAPGPGSGDGGMAPAPETCAAQPDHAAGPEEEPEYLDRLARAEEAGENARSALDSMGASTEHFAEQLRSHTSEMQNVASQGRSVSPREARKLVDRAAADMESYAKAIESNTNLFRDSWSTMIEETALAASTPEAPGPGAATSEAKQTLVTLESSISDARSKLGEFRGVITRLPRMTSRLNAAKARLARRLLDLDRELGSAAEQARNLISDIE